MNNVIQVLSNLASDASLLTKQDINMMLENANITELQQQAILNTNTELLASTLKELPCITAFVPLIAADEDEAEQVVTSTTKKVANA